MNYPRYEYPAENELNIFEFDSIGNKGKITKIVQYTEMSNKKLEEFRGKILFPKKLALANEMLSKAKLPILETSK